MRYARHPLWRTSALAILALLAGGAPRLVRAEGALASSLPTRAAAVDADGYIDPDQLVEHFGSELARIAKEYQIVVPEELARQAEQARAFAVKTLPDPGRPLRPDEIYAAARPCTVLVGAIGDHDPHHGPQRFCATGFVIHPDGIIATNYHLFPGFRTLKAVGVMAADGRVWPVKQILAADPAGDVAVLKIDAQGLPALPVAADVRVGQRVFCLSHPVLDSDRSSSGLFAFTQGMVSGKYRLRLGEETPIKVLTITADYAVGSSGGPILNEHGAVVGVACQTSPIVYDLQANDVQMVWKLSRPSSTLLALLKGPGQAVAAKE